MLNEAGVYLMDNKEFLEFIEALNDYYNGDDDGE